MPVGPVQGRRTACDLMVMPRSRSMSMRSRYWARISRWSTTPVACNMRSASVDLPWSMWAMMQKLRITEGSVDAACGTRPVGVAGTPCCSFGFARDVERTLSSSHAPSGLDT